MNYDPYDFMQGADDQSPDMSAMTSSAQTNQPDGYAQSTLGGRQDSQRDARTPDYAGLMNAQVAANMMLNPYNSYSSAMANAYTFGKRGLGAMDPVINAEQKALDKDYNSPWGILTKGVTGLMMGHDVGSMKNNINKAMMEQQNRIASIYGSDMTPQQKAEALSMSGNPTAQKLGSTILSGERARNSQANQDRNFAFKQNVQAGKENDIALLAEQAVKSGYLDPRGMYGKFGAVKAYLEKNYPDFDANGAIYKTEAMRKQIQSLNGPQQTRLHQAISSVEKSIPEMARLNDAFNRSGFIPMNRLVIGLRQNNMGGVNSDLKVDTKGMNPDQVQIAQQFVTQMNIMRDETAQVFSGGYAPTEAAFHLADQVLNPFYGNKVTKAGLDQLGTNLKIRRAALSDVQAMVPNFNPATGSDNYFDQNDPNVISTGQGAPAQKQFATEKEALASGVKGEVIIGGRRARID